MKKIICIVSFLFGLSGILFSQTTQKFGHINTQELLTKMPESDSVKAKFDKLVKDYQSHMEELQVEFNKRYQEYISKRNSYTEITRQMKESELQDMNNRIQQFQVSAQEELEKKKGEIYSPVLEKARKAISDVAKSNNFAYIFDANESSLLYYGQGSIDIMPLVKQKLLLK